MNAVTETQKELDLLNNFIMELNPELPLGEQAHNFLINTSHKILEACAKESPKPSNLPTATHVMVTKNGTLAWLLKEGELYKLIKVKNLPSQFTPFKTTSEASIKRHSSVLKLIQKLGYYNPITKTTDYEGEDIPAYSASTIASVIAGHTVNGQKTIKEIKG